MKARAALVAGSAALALVAGGLTTSGPASADPLGDARDRAATLAKTVDALQTQVEVATERYDAVEANLGQAVTARLLAQRALDGDEQSTQVAQDQIDDRVRALYESGGEVSLLATVLDGTDPADALARYHVLGSVLSWGESGVTSAAITVHDAALLADHLATATAQATRLEATAATAATSVRTLLATQQQQLADAGALVRTLAAQQAAAAAAASAQDFAAALAAAGGKLDGSTTPPNATAAAAIAAARTKLGDPYQWGGTGPAAYDCSGLTQFAYGQAGIALPRVAADQYNVGEHVTLAELEPGDLLFWATDLTDPATIHHVAIYLGAGMMIAAPHTGDVVKVEPVYMDGFIGATRPYATTS